MSSEDGEIQQASPSINIEHRAPKEFIDSLSKKGNFLDAEAVREKEGESPTEVEQLTVPPPTEVAKGAYHELHPGQYHEVNPGQYSEVNPGQYHEVNPGQYHEVGRAPLNKWTKYFHLIKIIINLRLINYTATI